MDAVTSYQKGISAIQQGDMVNGRKYLLQSLKLNPQNDKAWIWVAKTLANPDKKRQCAERALAINPNNPDALNLKQSLATPSQPLSSPHIDHQQINQLMREAQTSLKKGQDDQAVNRWLRVLDIQSDHEEAMKYAVEHLMVQRRMSEVRTILYRAIDDGTENPTLLLSASDLAKQEHDFQRLDVLNERVASSDWVSIKRIIKIANSYVEEEEYDNAVRILQLGLVTYPDDPQLLNRIAQTHDMSGRKALAMQYYEQVANQATRSKLGKEADKRLSQGVPMMTDNERGSVALAWREVLGVFILFFLMAFQDAGLNFATMGAARWMGILLSLVGGYLLITATSSPQQQPLARLLGGYLPKDNPKTPQRKLNPFASFLTSMGIKLDEESYYVGPIHEPSRLPIIPPVIRVIFGISGTLMLIFAFYLVLPQALSLIGLSELHLDPEFYEAVFR